MPTVKQLHANAMNLAIEAFAESLKADGSLALRLFTEALELEIQAASRFSAEKENEPTRSILYRSAASMACNANDYEQAERLVAEGLDGYPSAEIKMELEALKMLAVDQTS